MATECGNLPYGAPCGPRSTIVHVDYNWGWVGWLVLSLVVIAGMVALVLFAQSRKKRLHGDGAPRDEAGRILAERFARGEIAEEQYMRQRRLLLTSQVSNEDISLATRKSNSHLESTSLTEFQKFVLGLLLVGTPSILFVIYCVNLNH